jgi:hypothetical protein
MWQSAWDATSSCVLFGKSKKDGANMTMLPSDSEKNLMIESGDGWMMSTQLAEHLGDMDLGNRLVLFAVGKFSMIEHE